ncbi:hypothetical protein ACHWQZ_G006133 [Mnemiopsis leidyi]
MKESKSGRKIRRCAEKFYDEDLGLNINSYNITTFDLFEKVNSEIFQKEDGSVSYLVAEDVTLQNIMRRGFSKPFIVRAETGKPPGLRVPDPDFDARDVERLVGPTRKVDVMDVGTQRSLQMTMHQWAKYFESNKRDTLLNVISLEISKTPLCELVSPPDFVRELDWVETAWPPTLKESQNSGTNNLAKMKYPKVQKYCLMSVRGSYTDFHVDFGGTSVWYHLVKGAKVFWLIPPTEENLSKFVKWTLAGKQSDIFFGDLVDNCYRINLHAGDTFYLPGGWIHGVYTPRKSLVFGGNFLHSYNIIGQLQVTAIEDITKVEARYLYPYFVEMVWFVLEKYHKHLKYIEERGKGNSVLLKEEVEGLNLLISRLEESSTFQAAIPVQIKEPQILLQEVRDLLLHAEIDKECSDYSEPLISRERNVTLSDRSPKKLYNMRLISTNRPFKIPSTDSTDSEGSDIENTSQSDRGDVKEDTSFEDTDAKSEVSESSPEKILSSPVSSSSITSPDIPRKRRKLKPSIMNSYLKTFELDDEDEEEEAVSSKPCSVVKKKRKSPATDGRKKNRRCGKCENCTKRNCGQCKFCLDMKCFGGPNLKRQSCVLRRCVNIANNKQQIFKVEGNGTTCVRCSDSQSDWKLNPVMTCWDCNITVHWRCQTETPSLLSPSEQELAILWRWRCKSCLEQQQQKYGIPLSLEVPHRNVAVPVTLSVPFTNVGSPVGNIFSKLAAAPTPRPEKQTEPKPVQASNIFSKFKPRVVLKDTKKMEMLKQAKDALETKSLISPSKLPILSGPSISALQAVKLPKLELKDPMKFGSSEVRTSPTQTSVQQSASFSSQSSSPTPSLSDLPSSSSSRPVDVGSSGCQELPDLRSDKVKTKNNEVIQEPDLFKTDSSSDIGQRNSDPPPLKLQTLQPVVTLTRLPSVTKPLRIFRHIKPLDEIYRNMLRFTPYPKLSLPNQTEMSPFCHALTDLEKGKICEVYCPQPEEFTVGNSFNSSPLDNSRLETEKISKSVENKCPNLKRALSRLEKFKPVFNREGIIRTPHHLNSTLSSQHHGTLSSPAPIPSFFPAKSYVRPDYDPPSFPDPSLDMSTVLAQTQKLLDERLKNPKLFEYQAPDNNLTPCPRLGVVYFRLQSLSCFENVPDFHDESEGLGHADFRNSQVVKSINSKPNVAVNRHSSPNMVEKKNERLNSKCPVQSKEASVKSKVKCRPLGTYSMRPVRKQRSFSYLY